MTKEKENAQLLAVVKIRSLVSSAVDDLNKVKSVGREIDVLTNKAIGIVVDTFDQELADAWSEKIQAYNENLTELKGIMKDTVQQIENRDAAKASEVWNSSSRYSSKLSGIIEDMKHSGHESIHDENKTEWTSIWKNVDEKFEAIQEVVSTCELKFQMIQEFTPKEVDELTDEILRHMPKNFSEKEAKDYEKEYLEAYEEIKLETSKKKNLWDRFLDVLAGGTQQSPAERVMMQRWVNGEKR